MEAAPAKVTIADADGLMTTVGAKISIGVVSLRHGSLAVNNKQLTLTLIFSILRLLKEAADF